MPVTRSHAKSLRLTAIGLERKNQNLNSKNIFKETTNSLKQPASLVKSIPRAFSSYAPKKKISMLLTWLSLDYPISDIINGRQRIRMSDLKDFTPDNINDSIANKDVDLSLLEKYFF